MTKLTLLSFDYAIFWCNQPIDMSGVKHQLVTMWQKAPFYKFAWCRGIEGKIRCNQRCDAGEKCREQT